MHPTLSCVKAAFQLIHAVTSLVQLLDGLLMHAQFFGKFCEVYVLVSNHGFDLLVTELTLVHLRLQ